MTANATGPRSTIALGLGLALLLTVAVYWPSLSGGYVFDDYTNIVANNRVHATSLDWDSLRTAVVTESGVPVRPLAMLSFAVDWYLGNGYPSQMRRVNLAIHLLNGLLLFGLIRSLAEFALRRQTDAGKFANYLALATAGAWLLAPINFTAVAYIVQRMESLCQVFVLAGLWGYVAARRRMLARGDGIAMALATLVCGTFFGALAKESAVLLPLYALIVEFTLFSFRANGGGLDRRIPLLFVAVLGIPACIAVVWLARNMLPAAAWANRPFTLAERLLTEPRILFDYVAWTLAPSVDSLSLYHDQIPLSRGVITPATTLLSMLGLLATGCVAILLRLRWPLVCVGVLWFLSAHLLTATVIPLELAFEHRNYFASVGLYLATFSILQPMRQQSWRFARTTAYVALIVVFAGTTWIRARDWGDPVSFAITEVRNNPNSPRTAYELGRTYVILTHYRPDSPFVPEAFAALKHAASMPGADALPDQALLLLAARLHQPADEAVWTRLREKLATQPLTSQNIGALSTLVDCSIDGACQFPADEMVQCFVAALTHTPPDVRVLSLNANYAINVLRDVELATKLARASVALAPGDMRMRRNLLLVLAGSGQRAEAERFYQQTLRELPQARDDRAFKALLPAPASTVRPLLP